MSCPCRAPVSGSSAPGVPAGFDPFSRCLRPVFPLSSSAEPARASRAARAAAAPGRRALHVCVVSQVSHFLSIRGSPSELSAWLLFLCCSSDQTLQWVLSCLLVAEQADPAFKPRAGKLLQPRPCRGALRDRVFPSLLPSSVKTARLRGKGPCQDRPPGVLQLSSPPTVPSSQLWEFCSSRYILTQKCFSVRVRYLPYWQFANYF